MSLSDLSDEELLEIVQLTLKEDSRVRTDFLVIECNQGHMVISGRLASDEELEALAELLTEIPELDDYENNVWVDDTLAFEGADDDDFDDDEEELEEEEEDEDDDEFEDEDE